MNSEVLIQLVQYKMPYGKYEGRILADLPVSYLEWMARENAFPKGKLGQMLHTVHEVKINGLEDLLVPLRKKVNG